MSGAPVIEAFAAEAEAFVTSHAQRRPADQPRRWGEGDDSFALFKEQPAEEELAGLAEAKLWQRLLFDGGFGWITGPTEYGGRGLDAAYERTWQRILAGYDTPSLTPLRMGTEMIGPTIFEFGSAAAHQELLGGIYRGAIVCCQLFSEPNAGSDLAGLQTTATRDGDGWVIHGQKVWTSHAHYADVGEVICRTDPDASKHRGLSAFMIDMRQPGVEVRRLRQLTGGASFNEVFLDGVRVTDDRRLGAVNEGWMVALHTLGRERSSIASMGGGLGISLGLLAEMLAHFGVTADATIRQRYARLYANSLTSGWMRQRMALGQENGGGAALGKLALTRDLQLCSQLVTDVLGGRLAADTGEWGTFAWTDYVLGVPGLRIAGGTDEVLRNIVAERTLGLPKG